jgi:hypothetical protein
VRFGTQRPAGKADLSTVLKVCPNCLGDLQSRVDITGRFFCCVQCQIRTDEAGRFGRFPDVPLLRHRDATALPMLTERQRALLN